MANAKQDFLSILKTLAAPLEQVAVEDLGLIEKAGLVAVQELVNGLVNKINANAAQQQQ